ncbi:manganese efflux pump MntP family protein [Ruminococcaceae bacterium OttesenSCG-928-D13]|nr:manganese efflux pump MntP family protein [Ruminococcaceae bacterium OttesenSCG-928-D13]
MNTSVLLLTAVGLAMDAFAVSISNAMCYAGLTKKQMVANSAAFGLFQGLMPMIGFFFGMLVGNFIRGVDHWVALVLLGFIGGKMLVEGIRALRHAGDDCPVDLPVYGAKTMLVQAFATSIDALAVGIGLAALSVNIFAATAVIALVTFAVCLLGGFLGRRFGVLLGDWAQIFGGLILVFIGLKIFIEHMVEHGLG